MTTFNLPDLGEGLAEAEIVRWHVNVGDAVAVDQPMLAVETAKAVVEVPAPFSGVIKKLHGQPGDVIATGSLLVEFEGGKGDSASRIAGLAAPPAFEVATRASQRAATGDAGTVVGNMPTSDVELIEAAHPGGSAYGRVNGIHHGALGASAVSSGAQASHAAPGAPGAAHAFDGAPGTSASPHASPGAQTSARLRAAPAARALAKHLGVNLANVRGTGRGGVIIVPDVIALSNTSPAPRTATARPTFSGGERLRGLRRSMAQSMSLARDNVTNCTLFDDADLHRWREGQDITTRLLRAIAAACKAVPALNAWYDGSSQTRLLKEHIDIGMAVDTPDGLIVPVIRNIGARTSAELRHDIDRLKRTARDRTVAPEDLRDPTFMLSNFGMIAGRYATPVVVPPMVAILGSGRLNRDVIAVADGFEAHLRMPLSLTFDHRCVTGGEAARFMAAVLGDLQEDI
jgi:pyruvate dehydrogenase E2 component (dihydrolipoamide acetyltransferase)